MSEIHQINKCEDCVHLTVCQYAEIRKEVLGKMSGKLDNCCCPEIFKFSFGCSEYYHKN